MLELKYAEMKKVAYKAKLDAVHAKESGDKDKDKDKDQQDHTKDSKNDKMAYLIAQSARR